MGAKPYDVIVIGGGPAGLTAALYLARSRRRTLVLDGGRPRNARAAHAHGVFTRDGTPPAELLREARRQFTSYPDAEFRSVEAASATGEAGCFVVGPADGERVEARRLLFACGVRDDLPAIPGLAELWGTRVHACAYCHGFEERDQPIATLAEGEAALSAVAALLCISGDLVLCLNGSTISAKDRARIAAHGVQIIDAPLVGARASSRGISLRFADGGTLERAALFMKSKPRPASELPAQLGCRIDGSARIATNESWETTIPGVYAAGDIAADKKFVAVAAASGAEAATAIDGALAQENFGGAWSGPLCSNEPLKEGGQ
jgi:thioredoxin reductase